MTIARITYDIKNRLTDKKTKFMQWEVTRQRASSCQLIQNTVTVTLEEFIVKSLSRLLNFLLKVLSEEFVEVRHVFHLCNYL